LQEGILDGLINKNKDDMKLCYWQAVKYYNQQIDYTPLKAVSNTVITTNWD